MTLNVKSSGMVWVGDSVIACLLLDRIHTSDPNSCILTETQGAGLSEIQKIRSHNVILLSILLGLASDNPELQVTVVCCLKDQTGFQQGSGQGQGLQEESGGSAAGCGTVER